MTRLSGGCQRQRHEPPPERRPRGSSCASIYANEVVSRTSERTIWEAGDAHSRGYPIQAYVDEQATDMVTPRNVSSRAVVPRRRHGQSHETTTPGTEHTRILVGDPIRHRRRPAPPPRSPGARGQGLACRVIVKSSAAVLLGPSTPRCCSTGGPASVGIGKESRPVARQQKGGGKRALSATRRRRRRRRRRAGRWRSAGGRRRGTRGRRAGGSCRRPPTRCWSGRRSGWR